jgi:hypothetical protein
MRDAAGAGWGELDSQALSKTCRAVCGRVYLWVADPRQVPFLCSCKAKVTQGAGAEPSAIIFSSSPKAIQ